MQFYFIDAYFDRIYSVKLHRSWTEFSALKEIRLQWQIKQIALLYSNGTELAYNANPVTLHKLLLKD